MNGQVVLGDIPAAAHRYMLGSRSALEWIIDRYQVKTDKAIKSIDEIARNKETAIMEI